MYFKCYVSYLMKKNNVSANTLALLTNSPIEAVSDFIEKPEKIALTDLHKFLSPLINEDDDITNFMLTTLHNDKYYKQIAPEFVKNHQYLKNLQTSSNES